MLVGSTVQSPGGIIEVAVLVAGRPQKLYRRPWDGKAFVAGAPGLVFTLQVKNLRSQRIEVISTIDGRHTLDDEPGDAVRCRGMVIRPNSSVKFSGWRISDERTRSFVFGAPADSVAVQASGSAQNVGVIGFAVHCEQASFGYTYEQLNFRISRSIDRGSLGTGMGDLIEDRVGSTEFKRDGSEPDVLAIGYDTEAVLRGRGIIAPAEANPFPGRQTGYAKY